MTTSMSDSENKNRRSVLVRVCPEFYNTIKDVQMKVPGIRNDAQATKIIYDQAFFDVNMAKIFQAKKKV